MSSSSGRSSAVNASVCSTRPRVRAPSTSRTPRIGATAAEWMPDSAKRRLCSAASGDESAAGCGEGPASAGRLRAAPAPEAAASPPGRRGEGPFEVLAPHQATISGVDHGRPVHPPRSVTRSTTAQSASCGTTSRTSLRSACPTSRVAVSWVVVSASRASRSSSGSGLLNRVPGVRLSSGSRGAWNSTSVRVAPSSVRHGVTSQDTGTRDPSPRSNHSSSDCTVRPAM